MLNLVSHMRTAHIQLPCRLRNGVKIEKIHTCMCSLCHCWFEAFKNSLKNLEEQIFNTVLLQIHSKFNTLLFSFSFSFSFQEQQNGFIGRENKETVHFQMWKWAEQVKYSSKAIAESVIYADSLVVKRNYP